MCYNPLMSENKLDIIEPKLLEINLLFKVLMEALQFHMHEEGEGCHYVEFGGIIQNKFDELLKNFYT